MRTGPVSQTPAAQSAPFKRRGRIVFALLGVLVLMGLVPLGTVAWKLIDVNREALTTAQQEFQLLLASSVADDLDNQVETLSTQMLRVARTLSATIGQGGEVPQGEVQSLLNEFAEDPLLFVSYSFSDRRGGGSVSAGELPQAVQAEFSAALQETLARMTQLDLEDPRLAVFSSPLIVEAEPSRALMLISAPVTSRGRLRGVLTSLIELQDVFDLVTRRRNTGHVIYVLDEDGRVLASTDAARVRPGDDASRSGLVQRFLSAESRARETMPYVEVRNGAEEHYLGSFAESGLRWGVFVRARQRDVYRPVREMMESTLNWSAVALLLAGLVAIFFARSLSTPINRLAAVSRAFARGDYSSRVQSKSRNEIGELGHTFNSMAEEIESQIRRLERAAEENNELFLGTIRALAQAIDAKDPYTRGHSVRVNRYAVIVARELGLDENQIRDIHVASLLHDVGKIGIHDSVLNKPGKLNPEEFDLMKTHTVLGASIMSPIRQMKDIIPGLRSHHERWRGGGYPDDLQGEEIPLMARIIAVADTFDAVTTNRPYQKTMTVSEALQVIERLKGQALDERVVEAFYRAFSKGLIRLDGDDEADAAVTGPQRPAIRGAASA